MREKVTLQDVANSLGVSKATVSLCLNGSTLVAANTRLRVLQKIDELGYVYNRNAASLSTGESKTIGLAVHALTNPYFTRLSASIEAVLSLSGRMSFLCNTDESLTRQNRFLTELSEHNADGLILCPALGTTASDLNARHRSKIPIVLIARDITNSGCDYVGNDDKLALYLATQHIIKQGHTCIAMLGGSKNTSVGNLRRSGFISAMNDAGISIDKQLLIDCTADAMGGSSAAETALQADNPPTAMVCFNDLVALGAVSKLYERGLRPGRDVALIGCDNIEEGSRGYIQLSTVNVQQAAIGQEAAEFLLNRLANPDLPIQRIIKSPELVVRGTCGANT